MAAIYEDYYLPHVVLHFNLTEIDLREHLQKILGDFFSNKKEVVQYNKAKLSYVVSELQKAQISSESEQKYKLPDRQVITIGRERFGCPQVLFKPTVIRLEQESIHKLTFSIMKCDVDVRKDIYNNIVCSGDITVFEGIAKRSQKETITLPADLMTVKIIAPSKRKYNVCNTGRNVFSYFVGWIGGWVRHFLIAIPVNVLQLTEKLGFFIMLILDDAIISLMTADVDDDTARDSDFGFAECIAVQATTFVIIHAIGQTPDHTIIYIPASYALRSTGISCENGDKNTK